MFVDRVKIFAKAGDGGNGAPTVELHLRVQREPPALCGDQWRRAVVWAAPPASAGSDGAAWVVQRDCGDVVVRVWDGVGTGRMTGIFQARVAPIPPIGMKRSGIRDGATLER